MSNKPNYPDISIDEKDEYGKYSVELGFKGLKPQIATGLIESEELWLKLNELFFYRTEAKTTDRRLFPTSGYEFLAESGVVFHRNAEIGAYNSDGTTTDVSAFVNGQPEFYRIMLNYSKYHTLNPRLVFLYNLQAGLSLNSQGFIFDNFYLGGVQKLNDRQLPFVGINETQIISSSVSSAILGLQYNLAGSIFLTGKINTGIYDFSTEDKFYDSETVKVINGASLGIGYNLDALPMEITGMYSPEIGAFYAHFKIGVLF